MMLMGSQDAKERRKVGCRSGRSLSRSGEPRGDARSTCAWDGSFPHRAGLQDQGRGSELPRALLLDVGWGLLAC